MRRIVVSACRGDLIYQGDGYRPTLNSYMLADAKAIAEMSNDPTASGKRIAAAQWHGKTLLNSDVPTLPCEKKKDAVQEPDGL